NLECREVELIKFIAGVFVYCGCELFLLLGKISFRASQPTGNDVKSCPVPIVRSDPIECFSRQIELSKTQGRGGEIELTVRVFREQPCYLFAPPDSIFEILFLRGLRQNVESR